MKKTLALAATLILVLTLLCACSDTNHTPGSNSIVGKWGGSILIGSITLEFKSNGTYVSTINAVGQSETSSGTYSVDGNKITMDGDTTEYSIQGSTLYITVQGWGEIKLTRR